MVRYFALSACHALGRSASGGKGSYIIAWGATPGQKVLPKTIPHPVGVLHLPAFFPRNVAPLQGAFLGADIPLTQRFSLGYDVRPRWGRVSLSLYANSAFAEPFHKASLALYWHCLPINFGEEPNKQYSRLH